MTRVAMNGVFLIASLVFVAGCFDSLVDDPCAAGHRLAGGHCVTNGGPDAGTGGDTDGGIIGDAGRVDDTDGGTTIGGDAGTGDTDDAGLACTLPEILCGSECVDLDSDPNNCGTCDRVCASGICETGHCVGELSGHIIAIGHDYQDHNAAMARVLGNSAALGVSHDVGIARWKGSALTAAMTGTTLALAQSMSIIGRPWHPITLPAAPSPTALDNVDVLLVDAQTGDAEAARVSAVPWAATIDAFLQRGGIVVVLEGAGGVSHDFAEGAGLYTVAAPVDSTGTPAFITNGGDAVAQQVVSPYLADTTSVVLPGEAGVIVTAGGALVLHQTRY
jgi:hypothetical protein